MEFPLQATVTSDDPVLTLHNVGNGNGINVKVDTGAVQVHVLL